MAMALSIRSRAFGSLRVCNGPLSRPAQVVQYAFAFLDSAIHVGKRFRRANSLVFYAVQNNIVQVAKSAI